MHLLSPFTFLHKVMQFLKTHAESNGSLNGGRRVYSVINVTIMENTLENNHIWMVQVLLLSYPN